MRTRLIIMMPSLWGLALSGSEFWFGKALQIMDGRVIGTTLTLGRASMFFNLFLRRVA